ncbi:MAG: hypothetical protein AAGD11_00550 [Planctomycetota bacterium]
MSLNLELTDMRCTPLLALMISLTCSFIVCDRCAADLVFIYESATFDRATDAGAGRVEAEFRFDELITDGTVLTFADVTSWSMEAAGSPVFSDTSGAVPVGTWTFTFGDVGGVVLPVVWAFAAEQQFTGEPGSPEQIGSTTAADSFEEIFFSGSHFLAVDDFFVGSGDAAGLGGVSVTSNTGTWSVVTIPEPSAFLYGALVAGVVGIRRSRRLR